MWPGDVTFISHSGLKTRVGSTWTERRLLYRTMIIIMMTMTVGDVTAGLHSVLHAWERLEKNMYYNSITLYCKRSEAATADFRSSATTIRCCADTRTAVVRLKTSHYLYSLRAKATQKPWRRQSCGNLLKTYDDNLGSINLSRSNLLNSEIER